MKNVLLLTLLWVSSIGVMYAQWEVPTKRRFLTADSVEIFWDQVRQDPNLKFELLDISFWEDTFTLNIEGKPYHFETREGRTRNTYIAHYDDLHDLYVEGWTWTGAPDLRFGMKARLYNRVKQKFVKRKEPFFEPVTGTDKVIWGMWIETYKRSDVAKLSRGYVIAFGGVVAVVMAGVFIARTRN
ncbi:MAG: hypothetical protein D6722_26535 [Bacteroidetes bacterium]|nr:MAG: hypothetical protein D6722_26535 [Bacteroidota bacterium]